MTKEKYPYQLDKGNRIIFNNEELPALEVEGVRWNRHLMMYEVIFVEGVILNCSMIKKLTVISI